MENKIGEWSLEMPVTQEIQKISDQVKPDAEKAVDQKFAVFTAIRYKVLSLCGGTHYLIKVNVGGDEYIHLKVVRVIIAEGNKNIELKGNQYPKTLDDPLTPF
ncbi:cystatin-B-like [Misgurnus anguillicaudatus]|uniref:cystatin-B-like n=1 Tax=Misgurnus anguillicaudatus TaxID=75329 RepID=UPI003CCF5024